jgi:DNA-binding NarL/FixJ family response regulator
MLRDRLIELLGRHFDVCGQAGDAGAAVRLLDGLRPDVIVLDVSLPDMSGVDLTRALQKTLRGTRIVVITAHEEPEIAQACLTAGATAVVPKSRLLTDLIPAIASAARPADAARQLRT